MEQVKAKARPVTTRKRAARVRKEPKAIIAQKFDWRTWASDILIAVGWAITAALVGAVYAKCEPWVVFEVGFAAAGTFGAGIGWKIAEEVARRG